MRGRDRLATQLVILLLMITERPMVGQLSPQQALIGALGSHAAVSALSQRATGATAVHQATAAGENRLLQRLPSDVLSRLRPQLTPFTMKLGTVSRAPGEPTKDIYFLGIPAHPHANRPAIETGMIGRDGMVGAEIALEGFQSFGQVSVQIPGSAVRIGAAAFEQCLKRARNSEAS